MSFGEVLLALRQKAGLSQTALAEKAGTSQKAISFWEEGKREPSFSNIQKLCQALGVTCDVFFASEDPPATAAKKSAKKK